MLYKNISGFTKTVYGVTYKPGEVHDSPYKIHSKAFECVGMKTAITHDEIDSAAVTESANAVTAPQCDRFPISKRERKSQSKLYVKPTVTESAAADITNSSAENIIIEEEETLNGTGSN